MTKSVKTCRGEMQGGPPLSKTPSAALTLELQHNLSLTHTLTHLEQCCGVFGVHDDVPQVVLLKEKQKNLRRITTIKVHLHKTNKVHKKFGFKKK